MITRYLVEVINELKSNTDQDLDPGIREALLALYWDNKRIADGKVASYDDLAFVTRAYHRATVQRDVFKETVGGTLDEIDQRYVCDEGRRLRKRILVLLDLAVAQFDLSIKEMACHLADLEVVTI